MDLFCTGYSKKIMSNNIFGPYPAEPPCMPADCTMTRWKSCGSPGAPSGFMRSRRRRAETAPESCPASVMRVGSPPKAKMLR